MYKEHRQQLNKRVDDCLKITIPNHTIKATKVEGEKRVKNAERAGRFFLQM